MTITPIPAPPEAGRARTARPARASKRNIRLAFLIPAAVFFALFSFYPLFTLVKMSPSDVTAATLNLDWVFSGLENFRLSFETGETTAALWRTLVFVLFVTIVGMVGGLAAAIALRTKGKWSAAVLAVMVFVWALPPVVNGSVWKFLFADAGLLNIAARGLGLTDSALPFLYDPEWALWAVAFVNAWAVIPFNALVFRAALVNIPPDVFEAAALDGATKWQEIRHIMIPAARPTALVLLVLTIVFAFRSFDYIYVMTFGGPGTATTTLPFLGYLQAFARYDFGLGSATSVITVAFVIVLALVYARSIRREENE